MKLLLYVLTKERDQDDLTPQALDILRAHEEKLKAVIGHLRRHCLVFMLVNDLFPDLAETAAKKSAGFARRNTYRSVPLRAVRPARGSGCSSRREPMAATAPTTI